MSNIKDTVKFFVEAKPEPTGKDFQTQLGCHVEEFVEMLETLEVTATDKADSKADQILLKGMILMLKGFGEALKSGELVAAVKDRTEFLDGLMDQIVTATGTAYMAGMDPIGALTEVNRSNLSKFDDNGKAILDNNGKITKGPNYFKPNLKRYT